MAPVIGPVTSIECFARDGDIVSAHVSCSTSLGRVWLRTSFNARLPFDQLLDLLQHDAEEWAQVHRDEINELACANARQAVD